MIRSMTGYGQASADVDQTRLKVELRGVNHRFADLRVRLPAGLARQEAEIRRRVLARVQRGRVELTVNLEPLAGGDDRPQLNRPLVAEVLAAARVLHDEFGIEGRPDLATLLTLSGMFRGGTLDLAWDARQCAALERAIDAALAEFDGERRREGSHLQVEMLSRLSTMRELAAGMRGRAALLPTTLSERLHERLKTLLPGLALDPARVAQEVAVLADRGDVTEELVRLDAHLDRAQALLERPDGEPLGKRLEFLLQELQRETNTISSKSADLPLSQLALAMKSEVERVREQASNLE
jgi:uncharacterized protein (TIGR00255 family)